MNAPQSVAIGKQISSLPCQGQPADPTLNCDWISTCVSLKYWNHLWNLMAKGEEGKLLNHCWFIIVPYCSICCLTQNNEKKTCIFLSKYTVFCHMKLHHNAIHWTNLFKLTEQTFAQSILLRFLNCHFCHYQCYYKVQYLGGQLKYWAQC